MSKSEAIVKEILGALAEKYVEDVFKAKEGNEFSDVYFNVITNKENRKMYPVCVQFVSFDKGCQTRSLDLFECSSETADAISNKLWKNLILNLIMSLHSMQITPMPTLTSIDQHTHC